MVSQDCEAALRITPLFYDAVLDPSRWPGVLGLLTEQFAGMSASLTFGSYAFASGELALYSVTAPISIRPIPNSSGATWPSRTM